MNKIKIIIAVIILFLFHDIIIGQKTKFKFIDGSVYTDSLFVLSKRLIKKDINQIDSFFHIKTKGYGYIIKDLDSKIFDTLATMTDCKIANDTVLIYNSDSRVLAWDRSIIKLNIKDSTYTSHLNKLTINDLYKLKDSDSDFNKEIDLHPVESSLYFYKTSCFMTDSIISGYIDMKIPAYIFSQNNGDNTYENYEVNNLYIRSKFECILFENIESMLLDID